jgi:hypothetical protein
MTPTKFKFTTAIAFLSQSDIIDRLSLKEKAEIINIVSTRKITRKHRVYISRLAKKYENSK